MSGEQTYVLGVDVGTASVRAGVFDLAGAMLARAEHPIRIFRPAEDHVEQSSRDIWSAVGASVRSAVRGAGVDPERVAGLSFDATCSLVALDEAGAPVTVSLTGASDQNVVVWMDHRARAEADAINATGHRVLEFVGGALS